MLLITADVDGVSGKVFLQNAETIRLVTPEGKPVSVVTLAEGDKVLVRTDVAGRHFGMRIAEEIKEG
jgi:3-dehydroquinate synthase II